MSRSGFVLDALLRRVLPEEFADDVVGDLREGYARRVRRANTAWQRSAAAAWWVRETVTLPYVRLRRQARRLRAAGARREMSFRGGGGMISALQLRVAARSLVRRPAHSLVAVLTLVLGVGAATLVFSVLEGVLLRPLPYPSGDRLYVVFGTDASWRDGDNDFMRAVWDRQNVSLAMLESWRTSASAVEAVGAFVAGSSRLDDDASPVELPGALVLPGFFAALETQPILGRLPSTEELASQAPVVVIGERLWASRYGRDPEVLGHTVSLDGRTHTVIGVLPADFAVPSEEARWWAPLGEDMSGRADLTVFRAVLRRSTAADGATLDDQLDAGVQALAGSNPAYGGKGAHAVPLRDEVVSSVKQGIMLLFWAVVLVMLIACVNLTALVVARVAHRRPELALRSALGAGRGSLIGATLGETMLLCAVGGGLGLAASTVLVHPLMRFLAAATPGFPRTGNVRINVPVLLFSLGLTVTTALLAGAVPAWLASKRSPWEALQEGRRSRGGRAVGRTQRLLLFLETAMAAVLLVGAGLLTRSALYVSSVDPGFDKNVAFVRVQPPPDRYNTAAQAQAVVGRAADRVAAVPGVQAVGTASTLPGMGGSVLSLVWADGQPAARAAPVAAVGVDSGYFSTLHIPLVEGRGFQASDRRGGEPVAVVSRRLARQMFGGGSAVGRLLRTDAAAGEAHSDSTSTVVRVVGVAEDVRQLAVVFDPDALLYRPLAQIGARQQVIVARGGVPAAGLVTPARREVLAEDPDLLAVDTGVLGQAMMRSMAPLRLRTLLVGVLSTLAVILTLVGIYGVVAYVVSDRTQEIGVRMALGARAGGESARMVGVTLRPVILGGLLGLGGAAALSGILQDALFGVQRLDPTTYVAVLALLVTLAAAAAWLPARRAATVDPVRVLNDD